ncbi:MAG: MFS transporter [Gammaproteobacteria bacterium]|nr:MFS transporter [Gammaproteobacteria bacterium]
MINPLIAITRKHAILFAAYLVFYEFLVYIANDMIMPGMLTVVQDFHADESRIATSLTAYILGGASLQLLLGPISDRFGRQTSDVARICVVLSGYFVAAVGSHHGSIPNRPFF